MNTVRRFSRHQALALAAALSFALGEAGAGARQAQPPETPAASERPARPHFQIPRISSPIKIDGVLDDPAWNEAVKIDVNNETDPGKNVPAPVTTICYLAYDDQNLYAGFRANDPDPSAIRAHLTDRDVPFRDDFVGLIMDTFNDERRGYELFVNPLGVQMDLSLDETAEEEEDAAWDAIWSSAGRIDEQGYVVEMAIPFSSLRFQRSAGEQTWGIGPFRAYPRSLRHQIVAHPVDPNDNCFVCQAPKVTGFAGAEPGRNIQLDPTLTAQRTDRISSFPDGTLQDGDEEADLGLTARWGITPNLTLSGAINPDFSQVEADAVEFDVNTQFALFFPEKRPFFLEGADFFDSPFDVVYTRTVADPSWGVKLTGKEGRNAIGFFASQDDTTNLLLPGPLFSRNDSLRGLETTDAALRYRRDLGAGSSLGAIVTHREGGEYLNSLAGIDGRWRLTPSDVVTVQALSSRTEYPELTSTGFKLPEGRLEGSAWRAGYDHSSRRWRLWALGEDVDEELRADLGFLPKVGYSLGVAGLERSWWAPRKTWYSSLFAGGEVDRTEGEDGTVLEEEVEGWVGFRGPWQSLYLVSSGQRERYWNGVIFEEDFTHFTVEMRPSGMVSLSLESTLGDTIDFDHTREGDLFRLRPSLDLNLGRHLQVGLDHDLQRVDVDGGELLELNVSQIRTVYQINIRTFVRAVLQYTDLEVNRDLFTAAEVPADDEHLFSQLLFSYKLNPTTVLFLGYSDNQLGGVDAEWRRIDLTRADRTFFFKVGYALVL